MRWLRGPSLAIALRLVAVTLSAALPGCGGSDPSGGPGQARPTAYGLDFTITPMVNTSTVVDFRWNGSGTSSYTLEVGSSSGASDVGTFDTPGAGTTYTWKNVPIGTFYARVKAHGPTTSITSNEVVVGSIDARQMIDALIFGHGPLAVAGNAGRTLSSGYWKDRALGWQPGASFTVILGESVPPAFVTSAEKTVEQIGPATRNAVQAVLLEHQPDPLPLAGPGEVTVSMASPQDVKKMCNCEKCVGCASTYYLDSFAQRAGILISTSAQPQTAAHELGHVIGLAHIISAAGVRPPFTMGFTTDGEFAPPAELNVLDPATIQMLEALYDAGLTAGSLRPEFEAAGFVTPASASGTSFAESDALPPGYVMRQEGLETVVVKPICEGKR
jgi:hypothetical protein